MPSIQHKYKETLVLIADILSFKNPIEQLVQTLESQTIDWEQFVVVASDFLVLTTCYCRLKDKELTHYLPEDLVLYLEEITVINRNRNKTLLSEITNISELLKTNQINHVFLKGSAFLLKNLYNDPGERMLGDIDVLVDPDQLDLAYTLLTDNGYKGTERGITSKYFDYKHLPRLQSDKFLAAVEVHRKVTLQSFNGLLATEDLLNDKQLAQNVNVPANDHLLYHTILNFQANDLGYKYSKISFKSIYDVLILNNAYTFNLKPIIDRPYFKNYFSIAKIWFTDFKTFKSNRVANTLFLLKLKYPFLRKIIDLIISKSTYIYVIITSRILFFFRNKNYRKDLFKDYKRILGFRKLKKS